MTLEVAEIVHELKAKFTRSLSPWRDRKGAADYCQCGASTIDEARKCGFVTGRGSSDMPRFRIENLDAWIECGMPTKPDTDTAKRIKSLTAEYSK